MITIIPTSTAEHLAKKLQKKPGIRVVYLDKNKDGKNHFPDNEVYVRISKINQLKNQKVVILHSGQPNPNNGLIELEMILEILKSNSIKNVEVFFTYFPYSQQDKAFRPGELNAAKSLIEKLVDYYKVKKIYAIDAHFYGRSWFKKYPLANISTVALLKEVAEKKYSGLIFLAPDFGSVRRTKITGVEKKRFDSYRVEVAQDIKTQSLIKNKVIAVVDDLLETGGTMDRFYDYCQKAGAKDCVALITHGVLPQGIAKIKKKYLKLYLTNTIDRSEANIDISKLIYKNIT